jgi:hypothetical protein
MFVFHHSRTLGTRAAGMRQGSTALAVLLVCALMLIVAGCGGNYGDSPEPTPAQIENENEPGENETERGENENERGENENERGENENERGENENERGENENEGDESEDEGESR